MQIPPALGSSVERGDVVLFLGSGASAEAKNDNGDSPPTGSGLARMLSERFLGGTHASDPLHVVGELAISEPTSEAPPSVHRSGSR